MSITALLIGHITKDIMDDGGSVPGGAVVFASHALAALGMPAGVVTSAATDDDCGALPNDNWCRKPSGQTTTFRNYHLDGRRQQYLLARASGLQKTDIPQEWLETPAVLICSVARETGPELASTFPRSLCAISLQGALRQWDRSGHVSAREGSLAEYLTGPTIAIASREDIGSNRILEEELMALPQIAVITEGRQGCLVRSGSEIRHVEAFPANEVDSTGAGDVFAAAFLYYYVTCEDAFAAARFGACAASLFVEHHGLSGMPSLEAVRLRVSSGACSV